MIEKRGDTYRVRQQVDGVKYSLSFDHSPTKKEIREALEAKLQAGLKSPAKAFNLCAAAYIDSKSSVLSPSTIRGYHTILRNIPDDFLNTDINEIDTLCVQNLVNEFSKNGKSAKYIRNIHGFIVSVLGMFVPSTVIRTTLPKKPASDAYRPTAEDVERILAAARGSDYEVGLYLAAFGLRRSEQIALTMDDLEGNTLHINSAKVQNDKNEWIVKETKTESSERDIELPDYLANLIREKGFYTGFPNSLYRYLQRLQRELGIPQFSLHTMRHYFAARMSTITDEATVLELGGWKTPYVMKSVYRYALDEEKKAAQKKALSSLVPGLDNFGQLLPSESGENSH